jgi:hypothetical protein
MIFLLLMLFCAETLFGQEKTNSAVEIIKFKNIKFKGDRIETFLSAFLRPFLSKNGSVEFDIRDQEFIFTDTPNRIKLIKKFTEIIDESGFRPSNFPVKISKNKKNIAEFVQTYYLYPILWCDVGEEYRLAKLALQENLLIKMIEEIKVRGERTITSDSSSGLNLTGTKKQIALAKKIIELFDQPILIEDYDF